MKKKTKLLCLLSLFGLLTSGVAICSLNAKTNLSFGKDQNWWEANCVLPTGYTSIGDFIDNGVVGETYTIRGTVTKIESRNIFIQSQERGVELYISSSNPCAGYSVAVGNVIDVTGTKENYKGLIEIIPTSISTYALTNPYPVEPIKVLDIDDLSDLSCSIVKLDNIKVTSTSSKNVYTTVGGKSLTFYAPTNSFEITSAIAEMVSNHPNATFEFTGLTAINNNVAQCHITDVSEFIMSDSGDVDPNHIDMPEDYVVRSIGPLYTPKSGDKFSVSYLEMCNMYGDSILIDYGDFEMIIDAGSVEDGDNVMAALADKVDDGKIEIMLNTHPHVDHFGGFTNYSDFADKAGVNSVDYLIKCGGTYTTTNINLWNSTCDNLIANGTTLFTNYEMIHNKENSMPNLFKITNDIYFQILDTGHYIPNGEKISDANESSIAILLTIGNTRYFLTGDNTNDCIDGAIGSERGLIYRYADTGLWDDSTFNIVKMNHHGSQTHSSNSLEWAQATKPDYVICSSAIVEANRTSSGPHTTQHPYKNSIDHYYTMTDNVYWNGINGTITFTHDSINADPVMTCAGRTIDYYDNNGNIVSSESERYTTLKNSMFYKILNGVI